MNFLEFFTSPIATDVFLKLLVAFILSAAIGIERELVHKPAGIKTHTLICLSSTLLMILGMYIKDLYPNTELDPTRLPAQILAGIGFVGAGTILREGLSVKGITTAASLLATTCIGLAVGAGFYEGAVFATILIFLILCFVGPVKDLVSGKGKVFLFSIVSSKSHGVLPVAEEIFESKDAEIYSIRQFKSNSNKTTILKFLVKCKDPADVDLILKSLHEIDGITEVNTTRKIIRADAD